jgi:radical SAM superfamily enzyme YgiQ (UPF0313 family)
MVLARDFDLLAISCNSSFHYLGAHDLATAVRSADEKVPIVVGGCHVTAAPEDFVGSGSPFDVVVRGEGEVELLDLALNLDRRPSRTRVVSGRPLPLDRVYADFGGYPYWIDRPHNLSFPLSRGCPFSCTFCAGAERSAWRAYPPQVALSLIEKMIVAGPEVVSFCDPCFGHRLEWRREVLKGLAALKPTQVVQFETRADTLTDEDVGLLEGVDILVELGIETGSPRMAEVMHKARDGAAYLSRADRTLASLGRRHIPTHVFLLINHPGETRQSLGETLAFAERLADDPDISAYATAHKVMYFPGTAIQGEADYWRAHGTRVNHPSWWHERGPQGPLADAIEGELTHKEITDAAKDFLRLRAKAIASMPASARFTWRRVRAPLHIPKHLGGFG